MNYCGTCQPPLDAHRKHTGLSRPEAAEGAGGEWAKAPGAGPPVGQGVEGKIPHAPPGPGGSLPARLSSPGDKPPAQVHVQDQMNPLNRLRDPH